MVENTVATAIDHSLRYWIVVFWTFGVALWSNIFEKLKNVCTHGVFVCCAIVWKRNRHLGNKKLIYPAIHVELPSKSTFFLFCKELGYSLEPHIAIRLCKVSKASTAWRNRCPCRQQGWMRGSLQQWFSKWLPYPVRDIPHIRCSWCSTETVQQPHHR